MWRSPHRNLYSETLREKEKTWWWPYKAETCCFTSNLRIYLYIFYIRYELCFWLPAHLSSEVIILHRGLSFSWYTVFPLARTRISDTRRWGGGLGAPNFEILEDGERVTVCSGEQNHKFVIVIVESTGTRHALLRWMCIHTTRARARDHRTVQCRLAYRLVVSNLQSVFLRHPCPALRWIAVAWAQAHPWYVLYLLRCTKRGTKSSQTTSSLDAP